MNVKLALSSMFLLLASATACDNPMSRDKPPAAASDVLSSARSADGVVYSCELSARNVHGQEQSAEHRRRMHVVYARAELAPGSATRKFTYRGYANGTALVRNAECTVPATRRAMERIARTFIREEDPGAPTMHVMADPWVVVVTACQYGGTYPNCNDQPSDVPVMENDCAFYGTCDTTSGPGGGGAGGSGSPAGCDPIIDPAGCNKPLTPADKAMIQAALKTYVKSAAAFADTATARKCGELASTFQSLFDADAVFRGGYDGPSAAGEDHQSAYNPVDGTIHFEPSSLDGALSSGNYFEIAYSALHEAGHTNADHPDGYMMLGTIQVYSDAPFNLLNPGPNSC